MRWNHHDQKLLGRIMFVLFRLDHSHNKKYWKKHFTCRWTNKSNVGITNKAPLFFFYNNGNYWGLVLLCQQANINDLIWSESPLLKRIIKLYSHDKLLYQHWRLEEQQHHHKWHGMCAKYPESRNWEHHNNPDQQ